MKFNSEHEKNEFAKENFNLIYYAQKQFVKQFRDYDELFSLLLQGYTKAINGYDESSDTQFSTYAIKCMQNEVYSYLKKEKKKISAITFSYILNNDKEGNTLSVEDVISNDDTKTQTPYDFQSPEEILINNEKREELLSLLDCLNDIERKVVTIKYGLDGNMSTTLSDTLRILNIPKSKGVTIHNRAMRKLKNAYLEKKAGEKDGE